MELENKCGLKTCKNYAFMLQFSSFQRSSILEKDKEIVVIKANAAKAQKALTAIEKRFKYLLDDPIRSGLTYVQDLEATLKSTQAKLTDANKALSLKPKGEYKAPTQNVSCQTFIPTLHDIGTQTIKPSRGFRLKLLVSTIRFEKFKLAVEKIVRLLLFRILRAASEPKAIVEPKDPINPQVPSASDQTVPITVESITKEVKNNTNEVRRQLTDFQEKLDEISKQTSSVKLQRIDADILALRSSITEVARDTSASKKEFTAALEQIRKQTIINANSATNLKEAHIGFIKHVGDINSRMDATFKQDIRAAETNMFKQLSNAITKVSVDTAIQTRLDKYIISMEEVKQKKREVKMSERKRVEDESIRLKALRQKNKQEAKELKKSTEINTAAKTDIDNLKGIYADLLDEISRLKYDLARAVEARDFKGEVASMKREIQGLKVEEIRAQLTTSTNELNKIKNLVPNLEAKAEEIQVTLSDFNNKILQAKGIISDLSSLTKEKVLETAAANRLLKDEETQEIRRAMRLRRVTAKKAKILVAKENIIKAQNVIKGEIELAVPKIVSFVNEWNSLKDGDFFLFRGKRLQVDSTFNPSIRITHLGQDGDKWEAQKFANSYWHARGILTLQIR